MLRKILIIIAILGMLLCILPYLIPVTKPAAIPYPFENSKSYTTGSGATLHYREWRPAQGAGYRGKILLIHGLGGSTFSWRHNVNELSAAGYYVVAADLPGFGYSDRSRGINHSQANRATLLWELAEKLDADSKTPSTAGWILIGHSMGAGTITSMAYQKPEQTRNIIYVSPAILASERSAALFKIPPVSRWLQVGLRYFLIREDRIASFLSSAYGRDALPLEVQGYLEPLTLPGTESALADFVQTSTQTTLQELQSLQMPIAAIWGRYDSWVPISDADQLKDYIPAIRLHIFDDAYHCPMETDPDAFNRVLLTILSAL